MLIAKIDNENITVGDYRDLFPNTSFPVSGPDDNFYQENSCVKVSVFKQHDSNTHMLMACDPYLEDNMVYTVCVVEKPQPQETI